VKRSLQRTNSLLFSACALSLSGCFDIENKVILRKDTFSAEITLRFPKELMEMAGEGDNNLWVEFEIPRPWYKKMWSIFE